MPHAAATVQTSTIMFSISFNILGDKHKKKNPRNCSSSVAIKQTLTSAQKSSQNSNTQYIRG